MPAYSEPSPSAFGLHDRAGAVVPLTLRTPSIDLERPIDPAAPKDAYDGAHSRYAVDVGSPPDEAGAAASHEALVLPRRKR